MGCQYPLCTTKRFFENMIIDSQEIVFLENENQPSKREKKAEIG